MEYIPTTHQFVCVLNRTVEIGPALNALGHMALGLAYQHKDNFSSLRFRDFIDKSESVHPATSENPFIILKAKNGNKIRTLRNKLIADGVLFTDFTETMVPGNYVTQQSEFSETPESELEYYGVCFFMEKEKARQLTDKFQLYT